MARCNPSLGGCPEATARKVCQKVAHERFLCFDAGAGAAEEMVADLLPSDEANTQVRAECTIDLLQGSGFWITGKPLGKRLNRQCVRQSLTIRWGLSCGSPVPSEGLLRDEEQRRRLWFEVAESELRMQQRVLLRLFDSGSCSYFQLNENPFTGRVKLNIGLGKACVLCILNI